ncbi:MAG: FtsH protease activity modulator HflK [Legionellaceae bacterium]
MGWNGPDKDNQGWQGQKNGPPDLDEALKRLLMKFKKMTTGLNPSSDKNNPNDTEGGGGLLAIFLGFAVLILWILSGIFIVDPAEQAAILRFGRYVETVGAGPHWIPRLIETKVVVNVDRVSDYSYAAQMLAKDENLVSVALVVQYRIGDLQEYLFNVADPEESLQQATSSALRQVVGTTRLDEIITEGRDAWGSSVQETLVKILAGYKTGIVIVNVSPQPARAPENVQDAFDDAIKAQEDERRFKEQARAYEARVVPIAEGNAKRVNEEAQAYAEQVVLRSMGDVAEFLALLPEYVRSPKVTAQRMYLDAMQQVLSQTSTVLVDGKSGQMLYLPLDKLVNASSAPLQKMNEHFKFTETQNGKPDVNSGVLDGRETVRPTERLGRVQP